MMLGISEYSLEEDSGVQNGLSDVEGLNLVHRKLRMTTQEHPNSHRDFQSDEPDLARDGECGLDSRRKVWERESTRGYFPPGEFFCTEADC
jgi:hypothetical protein